MTDFFDDDLERVRKREASSEIQMGPSARSVEQMSVGDAGYGGGGELNLTRMSRHKEQVEDQVATAMKELERLRQRQEDLQSQKKDLEELRRKQNEYEQGKRDLLDRIHQSLVVLEKEEINAEQLVDLLVTSRRQFKDRIKELEALNDQNWEDEKLRTELGSALSIIEETRTEFNKVMARIQVQRGSASTVPASGASSVSLPLSGGVSQPWSFIRALTLGFAFSLPIILAMFMCLIVYYLVTIGVL